MRDKKSPEPDATNEEQALEQKVDAMMDSEQPEAVPPTTANDGQPPAIDIFSGMPDQPVKTVTVTDEPAAEPARTAPELSDSLPTSKKISIIDADRLRASVPVAVEVDDEPAAVSEPAESASGPVAADDQELQNTLDDAKTDAAVDQIAEQDSDTVLAVEDAAAQKDRSVTPNPKTPFKAKLKAFFTSKRTWVGFVILLVIVAIVPWTRYKVAGLAVHKELDVTVIDSKTDTAVTGAIVSFNGRQAKTNANGKADFRVPVGNSKLVVTKQYYKSSSQSLSIGFGSSKAQRVRLTAIGRQVPITVTNQITGNPLSGATIHVLNTTAKTNSKGKVTIVVPANAGSDKATVSLSDYNTTNFNIQVTGDVVSANNLKLVPSGKVYFLSNQSGTIDVVSTNLDGSNRQTVLAGTGKEDPNNTSLLASRDWKYLVLESQRSGSVALYLIDASNNKVTEFDSTNANFELIGWYGHDFMYDLQSNTIPQSQAGHETVKSYDADTAQLNQLDSNQVQTSGSSYAYQTFSDFYILNNLVVYDTQWYSNDSSFDLSSQNDTIRSAQPNGQGKKDYHSFSASQVNYIQAELYAPQTIYYAVNSSGNQTTYYQFADQAVSADSSLTQAAFNQSYPTYLISPSGQRTFWTTLRDGQNALLVGDQNGQSSQQLTSDGSYKPYGWYTDNYVLVSKGDDKLYIMPSGSGKNTSPIFISDYYKPAQDFEGYGYGYGGL